MAEDITVIVPTRNRTTYLAECVQSIQASAALLDGWRVRVLVVDDAPDTDEARDLVRALGADYTRVEVHDGLRDPGAAIVLGVEHTDTQWQLVFGDDDVMLPAYLPKAVDLVRQGCDVVSSSFHMTDASLTPFRTVVLRLPDAGDLAAGYTGINDGSMVRHDDVKDLEWDVTLEGQMLPPIWYELLVTGRRFGVVEEPTWLYRRHDTNISHVAASEKDLMLRAAARMRMRELAVRHLGAVPPSARAEQLRERAALLARAGLPRR